MVKGANDALLPADIDAAAEVLINADCIILQFEIPLETVYYTVAFARNHGIRCIVNPAPGQAVEMGALAGLDYLVPNESEAQTITGLAVSSIDEAKNCAERLRAGGVHRVIITLGEKGAFLSADGSSEHIPAFAVNSVDTSGAGDAFIGSFATFLAEGVPEREAIRRANLYAALSTTGIGTQKSFCNRAQFESEWNVRAPELSRQLK